MEEREPFIRLAVSVVWW